MSRDAANTFVWVDVETTGIGDPRFGLLLEIGIVITDAALVEVARNSWTFGNVSAVLKGDGGLTLAVKTNPRVEIDGFVVAMHALSGLWEDSGKASLLAGDLDHEIATWLKEQGIDPLDGHPMCGSSVGFDRAWMKVHLPNAEAVFGYRNADLSSLKELLVRWDPPAVVALDKLATKREIHRSIPDLEDTINMARVLRRYLNLAAIPPKGILAVIPPKGQA